MRETVSFNGKNIDPEQVRFGISTHALYGKGIFTTIAVDESRPFLWEKHWRRLTENAETLKIDLTEFSESATKRALVDLIEENSRANGRARITFFDTSSNKIWPYDSTSDTSLLITTGDLRPIAENFRLTVSPFTVNSRSPLVGVKSCNYLERLMAKDEAKGRGYEEAIQVNERGDVTSATMANVFWLKDRRLYTPRLATGCLPGTTREYVLENLECREVEAGIEELNIADAIYLTSAGLGVTSVAEYNGRQMHSAAPHLITQLLTAN